MSIRTPVAPARPSSALVAGALLALALGGCTDSGGDDAPVIPPEYRIGGLAFDPDAACRPAPLENDSRAEPYVGNIWRHGTGEDERFLDYWNQVTPEYAGKWGNVEAVRGVEAWEQLDLAYAFAKENAIPYKFHTLVWGAVLPDWVAELDPVAQRAEVIEWFDAIATRYPGIELVDVVNEPLHEPPPYAEAFGGDGESGWDWVIALFELARERFPDSELLLNDYSILLSDRNTDAYLEIIELLRDRDLIDGIGVQGHFLEERDMRKLRANLDRLGATGLPVHVSELDLSIVDDLRQAAAMRDAFTLLQAHPAVAGITLWGWREHQLWQRDAWLVGETGRSRPAMRWLACRLGDDAADGGTDAAATTR